MRKALLTLVIFVLLAGTCQAYPNEPLGYGGYGWGTPLEQISGLDEGEGDELFLGATRPADPHSLIIGDAAIATTKPVVWIFWEKKLGGVLSMVSRDAWPELRAALLKTFGEPTLEKKDDKGLYFYWQGPVGRVMLHIPFRDGEELGIGYSSYEFLLNKTPGGN